jgi:hypothetical protein
MPSMWIGLNLRLWTLAALILACSDEPTAIIPCTDDQQVEVVVSGDPIPVFSWIPACGMASLQVFQGTGTGPSSWVLYTGANAEQNPLRSGIRYGEPPPEAVEFTPAAELESGTEYRVVVYRWVGEGPGGPGSIFERGSTTFDAE